MNGSTLRSDRSGAAAFLPVLLLGGSALALLNGLG